MNKVAHYAMPHTPSMTPSVSFGQSSRTNSSSSLLPGSAPPGSSVGSSSHHRYERRPSLRHNPAWQGSVSSATGSVHSCTSYCTHSDSHTLADPPNTCSRRRQRRTQNPALSNLPTHASTIRVNPAPQRAYFLRYYVHAFFAYRP